MTNAVSTVFSALILFFAFAVAQMQSHGHSDGTVANGQRAGTRLGYAVVRSAELLR